ncbi:hypothetical protein [Actinoplanes sp. NPDC051494]|uniref:hypothetical protein n=1 Tax=Actinoplanes sp. NPDC051494 TaxID=3363907 RepID=UPI0037BC664D
MREAWWIEVYEAAQLLASQLNAAVVHAARVGVYTPPPGSPAPRRRRQPGSLRHLAEVIRAHRLAPGLSVDKDDVASVLAGDLRHLTDPVLVVAVARAAHVIARTPLTDVDAERLVVASTRVSALLDAARQADERAPRAVPAPQVVTRSPGEPVVIDAYFTTRRPGRRRALVIGALSAVVIAGVAAAFVLRGQEPRQRPAAAAPVAAAVAGVTPLEHGHASDDHLNPRPLHDALDHGFTSIGTDVSLRDGALVLCHHVEGDTCRDSRGARITERPFEPTYLQGLSARVNATGGRVYPGYHQPVFLFVAINCVETPTGCTLPTDAGAAPNNPLVVAEQIMSALEAYRGMLFHVDATARHWGPVQVVITGSHNDEQFPAGAGGYDSVRGLLTRQTDTYAFLDGSFAADAGQYNADLVPVISFPAPATNADCTYSDDKSIETVHWDEIIQAQTTGHHVRVWDLIDCPDHSRSWTDAMYASVDYLSSANLTVLDDWLTNHVIGGGGGHCTVPSWIAAARVHGQHCTLRTPNVPVMSRPDHASARVGTLTGNSAHWFLGQQPGESYKENSSTNFWWAYTRADNGQWGWVSLVHFTDAGLDQSANGLQYGCYDARPGEPDTCHPL